MHNVKKSPAVSAAYREICAAYSALTRRSGSTEGASGLGCVKPSSVRGVAPVSKIGRRQRELLREASSGDGVPVRGFAQRGHRSFQRLVDLGLLEWNFGKLRTTSDGKRELERADSRAAHRDAERRRAEEEEYAREQKELGSL